MSTLDEHLAWHDREIARHIANHPEPTPAEVELTTHLTEQRDRLLRLMAKYPKANWPDISRVHRRGAEL